MLVMGGIVGSGIFMNPHVVAREAPSAPAVLGAWLLGGAVALAAGFIWAQLAAMRPGVGGQYAYLRDGIHPAAGFMYGWSNLLVVQTGGIAAVAITFARYAHVLAAPGWSESASAAAALATLTGVNLLGTRAGGTTQSVLMVLKIGAIAGLVACGLALAPEPSAAERAATGDPGLRAFFAAMIAVQFAYGGWATATLASGDVRNAGHTLPRALVLGMAGVVTLYVAVTVACLDALGVGGLATYDAPASEVMRRALGTPGERLIAAAIAVSTLGFLAQGMLAAPRAYYAMARDGLFFHRFAELHPRTGVPHLAILLQGALAIATAVSGTYSEILSWVVTVDVAFLAATAATLFVFRGRGGGHPYTTVFFILVALAVVVSTFVEQPGRSLLGWTLVAAGLPIYAFWRRRTR
jgi:APA family basic amino acid/polyamine antiporter